MNEIVKFKPNKKNVGVIFLAGILLLIFFSKTIYNHNLPKITGVMPTSGRINKSETVNGTLAYSETVKVYSGTNARVTEVYVEAGDKVTAGQPLFKIDFDRETTEYKLKELAQNREKTQYDIEKNYRRLEEIEEEIEDLLLKKYDLEEVSTYDYHDLRLETRAAFKEYQRLQTELTAGTSGVTPEDVDKAKLAYDRLNLRYEDAGEKLAKQEEDAEEAYKTKVKERNAKIKAYEEEIATVEFDIKAKELSLENYDLTEKEYIKTLSEVSAGGVVTAPVDGVLDKFEVEKGKDVSTGSPAAEIGTGGGVYKIECIIPLSNTFVYVGSKATVSNTSYSYNCTVETLKAASDGFHATLYLTTDKLLVGEKLEVKFEERSASSYTLVPNAALGKDNDGYFLNAIKRRTGSAGDEYYLSRIDVFIGEQDSTNTAITSGMTFFEPVVLYADGDVSSGSTVKVENAGDFFD